MTFRDHDEPSGADKIIDKSGDGRGAAGRKHEDMTVNRLQRGIARITVPLYILVIVLVTCGLIAYFFDHPGKSGSTQDKVQELEQLTGTGMMNVDGDMVSLKQDVIDENGAVSMGDAVSIDRPGWQGQAGCDYTGNDKAETHEMKQLGPVHCTLTYDMLMASKGKREQFSDDPVGWPSHNVKVDNNDGKQIWLWNRSHLVADQLGGEASPRNAVPGTRWQNVGDGDGGMRVMEQQTAEFIQDNPECKVRYDVTPVYAEPSQSIPVFVDVVVQSCDNKLNAHVVVPNGQPGYSVNLSDGSAVKQ